MKTYYTYINFFNHEYPGHTIITQRSIEIGDLVLWGVNHRMGTKFESNGKTPKGERGYSWREGNRETKNWI